MTQAAVAADLHKALDVLVALTAEVALNHDLVLINIITDGVNLILGEVLNTRIRVTCPSQQDLRWTWCGRCRKCRSDRSSTRFSREVDTINTCHTLSPLLTLTLLMTGVLANDEDLAMAPNDFALIAHLLDRRTYLHRSSFR